MLDDKPTILIISYYYPPSKEMGANRVFGLTKYWPSESVNYLVLTGREGIIETNSDPRIFYTSKGLNEKITDWIKSGKISLPSVRYSAQSETVTADNKLIYRVSQLFYFFNRKLWFIKAYLLSRQLIKKYNIKKVYINCGPFDQSLVGYLLKKLNRLSYVLDFRDAWSLDPYRRNGPFLNWLISFLEKRVLINTSSFIVNSPSALKEYNQKYPFLKTKISLVYNGYDPELFLNLSPKKQSPLPKKSIITYAGTAYPGRIIPFLKKMKSTDLSLVVYGRVFNKPEIEKHIAKNSLEKRVTFHSALPKKELLQHLLASDYLLITQEKTVNSRVSPIAGKTLEYLKIGKPIIYEGPTGDNLSFIQSVYGTKARKQKNSLTIIEPNEQSPQRIEAYSFPHLAINIYSILDKTKP